MSEQKLSDKALSILAFAAYHSLASGEAVGEIVIDDGNGHKADPDGLAEIQATGLIEPDGSRGRLTAAGRGALDVVLEALRASQR